MPALLLALCSLEAWRRLVEPSGKPRVGAMAWFACLSFGAQLIYQPFAFAAWPMILLHVLVSPGKLEMKRALNALGIFVLVIASYFLFYKFLIMSFVPADGPHGRTSTIAISDIPEKLWWFASGPLKTSLTPLSMYGSSMVALAAGAAIIFTAAKDAREHAANAMF